MAKILSFFLLSLILFSSLSPSLSKSPRPITDTEIRHKKNACWADIESGLWGWRCRSSVVEKENCALRCLSPTCYTLVSFTRVIRWKRERRTSFAGRSTNIARTSYHCERALKE